MAKLHAAAIAIASLLGSSALMAETPEESALDSLLKAESTLNVICSPGLQEVPGKLLRNLGGDNPKLKISVETLEAPTLLEQKLKSKAPAVAIVYADGVNTERIDAMPLAHKGLALIVNAQYGPDALSAAQAKAALAGRVSDWSELGMPKGPLRVYCPEEILPDSFEPSAPPSHEHDSKEDETLAKDTKRHKTKHGDNKNPFLRILLPVANEAKALAFVAEDPCGMTAVKIKSSAAMPKGVKAVKIDGTSPDDSSYPLSQTVVVGSLRDASPVAKAFATLLLSENYGSEIEELGLKAENIKRKEAATK